MLPFSRPLFARFLLLSTVVLTPLGCLRLSDERALEQVASKYSREGCLMSYGQYIEYPTGLMPESQDFPAQVGAVLHITICLFHDMSVYESGLGTSTLPCPLF
jgi:hypothetical protein